MYRHFGYTLNRTASTQLSNGTSVSKSELQPGDLVFFKYNTSKAASHVGIYIGGGPCSCEWTALTLMRCTAIDGADAAQGGERGAGRWEGRRGIPAAPARRETELGFLQKGQIHLKIPPKTASYTKT